MAVLVEVAFASLDKTFKIIHIPWQPKAPGWVFISETHFQDLWVDCIARRFCYQSQLLWLVMSGLCRYIVCRVSISSDMLTSPLLLHLQSRWPHRILESSRPVQVQAPLNAMASSWSEAGGASKIEVTNSKAVGQVRESASGYWPPAIQDTA
jgi:hypothetical protein